MTDTKLPITLATEVSSESSTQTAPKWHTPTIQELNAVMTASGPSNMGDSGGFFTSATS